MAEQILVTKTVLPEMSEYIEEIKELWESRWITNMGAKHEQLQEELKQYLEAENIELLTNGHMALELSIQAMGLKGEVITTPFTFASTTHAIVRNGLEPVFCDIRKDDFTIDADRIEELVTDKTSAVIPVHVYGNICDIDKIEKIAAKYGLKVIYDAAHAFGERYRGKPVSSFGDISCFSFHATKVFHTIEGGAVCFRDKDTDFGRQIYRLKNFGIRNPDVVDEVGANAKMNEFCAAMGICNLRHLGEQIEMRRLASERYRSHLQEVDGIQLNYVKQGTESNYAYFPVIFHEKIFGSSRNEVHAELSKHGIYARKYFYPLTNTFVCYHDRYDASFTPNALYVSKRVLALPMYPELSFEDIDRICEIILSCRGQGGTI